MLLLNSVFIIADVVRICPSQQHLINVHYVTSSILARLLIHLAILTWTALVNVQFYKKFANNHPIDSNLLHPLCKFASKDAFLRGFVAATSFSSPSSLTSSYKQRHNCINENAAITHSFSFFHVVWRDPLPQGILRGQAASLQPLLTTSDFT